MRVSKEMYRLVMIELWMIKYAHNRLRQHKIVLTIYP